jgi:phosphatidylinositol alpha-1,6-mannosyltransferase
MKCLMVITGAFHATGGMAAVNRLVMRAIAEEGHQIDALVFAEEKGAILPDCDGLSRVRYRAFGGNKLAFTTAVWRAIFGKQYSLIFSDHVDLAAILAPFSAVGYCDYVVWLHGIEVFPPRPGLTGRIGLQAARKRLASSAYTQTKVTDRFSALPVKVCDLGLDPFRHGAELPSQPPMYRPQMSLLAIDGTEQSLGSRVILHVGRMAATERYKGQDCLLLAFQAVYDDFSDSQLVLVGQGDDMPRLRALAQSLSPSLQNRIFMPGYVDETVLDQLYRACCLFAMPSRGEGFGLVYLEAMSRAKACLGGRADAAAYVVRDGITGLLVDDPTSPALVSDRICWLLGHPERTMQMGLAGYDLVRSYYLFPHFKERFWKAIA